MTARFRRFRLRPLHLLVAGLAAATLLSAAAPADAAKKKPRARSKRAAAVVTPARVEVSVLHTTDLHGHLLPWNYDTGRPDPELGLSKVATLVHRVRAEKGVNTLLVDAGDCIQGTPLSYLHALGDGSGAPVEARPDPQMACMNAMEYDAFAVGNHEFNFGLDVLRRAQADARFPWLSANTLRVDPPGAAAYQSYVVKVIDGVRVGILGLTTPGVPHWDDPPNYAGLTFEDPLETARRMVPIMRGMERCDAVIIVCHMGLEEDDAGRPRPGQMPNENRVLAIARGVPGVDAIIMGHTHTRVEARMVNVVLLTQAGRWAEALGRLDLVFERRPRGGGYRLAERRARLIDVDESVASDPTVEALARPYHDATEAFLSTRIGEATTALDGGDARQRDNPLHELIHRAQLDATGADVSLSAMFNPRAKVPAGPITVRDAFALYPYENTLSTLELRGADLKAALEHSARYYNPYDFGRNDSPTVNPDVAGYNFDTAEGVGYVLDLSRPVGERVRNLTWRGAPLDPGRTLTVAVNNYRVNGGGGYTMLKNGRIVPGPRRQAREAVVAYLRKVGRVDARVDGNWRLAPAWVQSPEREPIERLVRLGVIPPDSALVYDLASPLTQRRFADWVLALPRHDGIEVQDPLGPVKRSRRTKHDPLAPAAAISPARALEWTARALPEGERAGVLDRADPWGLTPRLESDERDAASGRRLTVGEGALLLADALFPRLSFLHVTDLHGALLPGATDRATQRAWGGGAVLAAHMARERAKNPGGTILTDGGDWMQGTPISNLRYGRPVIELMNRLGVDAAAIGNHEFDWGVDTLRARMAEAAFQPLGANWFDRATGVRAAGVAPWTVVHRRGLEVGILGLCTESTPRTTMPQHVADFTFPDAAAVAAGLVDSMRAAGVDGFVVIGHLPARQDSSGAISGELADVSRRVEGELAILGGHSHNRVLGLVDGTPTVISGAHGTMIGRVDVTIDRRDRRPVAGETRLAIVPTFADQVRPDASTAEFVAGANARIEPITSRVLGDAPEALGRSRARDSALGNWITDAMRAATGVDIAFQNPGGIRAELEAGPVTVGDVYEVMPFDNQVMTVRLTGSQVLDVLEAGVGPTTCIQVSGITFAFDPERPRGERVLEARTADGARLDPARTYLVAANDFMTQGGDGFTMFARGQDLKVTGLLVREVMEKDVAARTARGEKLVPAKERRIENRGSGAAAEAAGAH